MKRRILVIGLDGATWRVLSPLLEEGALPTLAHLVAEGSHGPLKSTVPPLSGPAWVSFLTGKNPGKHGIFDFCGLQRENGERPALNATHLRSATVQHLVGRGGKRVGTINVPFTYPPRPVNGYVLTGMLTPRDDEASFAYPPHLIEELRQELGGYEVEADYDRFVDIQDSLPPATCRITDERGLAEEIMRVDTKRKETLIHLDREFEPDLTMLVFTSTDRVLHLFWADFEGVQAGAERWDATPGGEVMRDVLVHVDGLIGEILGALGRGCTTIIMSDHGFGPWNRIFYSNQWLVDIGLAKRLPVLRRLDGRFLVLIRKSLRDVLARLGMQVVADHLPQAMGRVGVWIPRLRDPGWSSLVRMDTVKAYSGTTGHQSFYVNRRDRERGGIVAPGAEYERVRGYLVERLKELRDPMTDAPLISRIYLKEEIYSGDALSLAPDVVVETEGGGCWMVPRYPFRPLFQDWNMGCHRPDGLVVLHGSGVKSGIEIEGARIIDLAPTILYLLGLSVPDDMDGSVLEQALEEDHLRRYPVRFERVEWSEEEQAVSEFTEEESAAIKDRLRGLGYIN
ncbi:hypothetical protein AMJ71_02590 [candidate division TA06 bacterium SM1_40]|uniref:Phosphodiesterase n=1 Tax=candidate division TA06 bacterium SM1_40 TaxID=1703773 RepID=A0A0S8JPP0_UNCT6|nr:MAG: hypothetical protein AMJ71_02590 [candidate division TA06 bacterium SM1_40]